MTKIFNFLNIRYQHILLQGNDKGYNTFFVIYQLILNIVDIGELCSQKTKNSSNFIFQKKAI